MKRLMIIISICFSMLVIAFISEGIKPTIATEVTAIEEDLNYTTDGYERLFNDSIKHHLIIEITTENFRGMGHDMLSYAGKDSRMRTGNYRSAKLIYEDEKESYEISDIGIRTKGNTSRLLPYAQGDILSRSHFKLKFDETFSMKEGTETYNQRNDRTFLGMNELILKSNMDQDLSYIHEKFAYDMFRKAGLSVPQISFATLTIVVDNEPINYGVYTVIEPIDKSFLNKRFTKKGDDGNLYKCLWQDFGPATLEPIKRKISVGIKNWEKNYRPTYDLKTNRDEADHEVLYDFVNNLNELEDDALKSYLDEHFEVEKFLKFLAGNVLLGMPDYYWAMGNNYYLYFNNAGKIEFFPYDYDNCLASGWDGSEAFGFEGIAQANIYYWRNLNSIFTNSKVSHPLVDKLLKIPEYKAYYEACYQWYLDEYYSYEEFLKLYDHIENQYQGYFLNDTSMGQEMTLTKEEWFMTTKIESVLKQLK